MKNCKLFPCTDKIETVIMTVVILYNKKIVSIFFYPKVSVSAIRHIKTSTKQ